MSPSEYNRIVEEMGSSDTETVLIATQTARKELSKLRSPPIDQFFERGAHKILSKLLDSEKYGWLFCLKLTI